MSLRLPDNLSSNLVPLNHGLRSGSHGRVFQSGPPIIGGLVVDQSKNSLRAGLQARSPGLKIKQAHIDIAKRLLQQEQ